MRIRPFWLLIGLAILVPATGGRTQPGPDPAPPPKFPEYAAFLKGSKVTDGLFTLHQKDDHLYAEIGPAQMDKPYLVPMAIAKGAGVGGATLNFGEQWVISFKRVGDKVFVIRRNTKFTAKPGTPAAKALDTTYSDSVLMALPIKTINPIKASVVIDLNSLFFSDFGDLGIGLLDRDRTTWHKVKGFKKNVELQVAATFGSGRTGNISGGHGNQDAIPDTRGTTVVIHYGIVELPEPGYSPRAADDRVGHFTTVMKDFSKESPDTAFVRYVNRWRLERADGSTWKEGAKLVPPKKKIVFWIENSVPDEYRAAVREGILEWNKAFEKIGYRDAIEVRQQESEDFDPEDITYATFRWITSETPYAIGPSRANPFTGELIDADILFDASMVRSYKGEARLYRDEKGQLVEAASPIQASRRGWDLPIHPLDELRNTMNWNDRVSTKEPLRDRLDAIRHGYCQCASHKMTELGLALMNAGAEAKDGKVPDELLQQAVKEVTMHEVGHTLGLRHNFKASTMLPNEQLHDTAITSKRGLAGSVMDYTPANIAPKGTKQGHYFTPTLGAYDYWAIEYAYTPNGSDEQLAKIASRCAEAGLIYGTDEDLYGSNDPHTNLWDLGADTLKFAKDRVKISQDLMPKLAEQVVEKGEGYQRARAAFGVLMNQYGNASALAAKHIGGAALHRDHKGDANARDPFVPTSPAQQRDALKFLQENILTDKPFDFPPELLRKLGADRWVHWGNERAMRAVEFPVYERVLAIQKVALGELLDPGTLTSVLNNARLTDPKEKPLEIAEVFRALSDSTFSEGKSSVIRRNLQREYVTRLSGIALGKRSGIPADARSLARLHLKEIGKKLADAIPKEKDDAAKAHFDELHDQIAKVLDAKMTTFEP